MNFFINLQKTMIIKKLEIKNKEISDPNEITSEINRFFELFSKTW